MVGVEDREVVVWVLGLIVAGFAVANRRKLSGLPMRALPLLAAGLLLVGWTLSIIEVWVAPELTNLVEHVAYVSHSALMLIWVYALARMRRKPQRSP